jgi:diguanylate cyclase (GGDEF)-like protein
VVTGALVALVRRIPAHRRAGAVALGVATALICAGDLGLALAGTDAARGAGLYVGAVTGAVVLIAFAPWIDIDPFRRVDDGLRGSSVVRAPFLIACSAIVIVVLAWAGGRPSDLLLAGVVVALLAAMVASQVLLGLENARLVDQVSHQADLFRDRATRDLLTGLPNRGEFTGRVEMALTSASRGRVAVLFVDLDGFKDVNDSYGHAIGDELLVEAATRLSGVVRESDVVARFGGDEFVALLQNCSNDEALDVAERLRGSLSEPYHVSGHEVVVSASIGLARPGGDDDAEAALRNADLALYSAKEGGRDRVAVYEPEMHSAVVRRMEMAALLRQALAFDTFALAFQPIVDMRTGKVHAMEALLRLEGIDLGPRGVSELIATAEESGIMGAVGGWVLDAAVGQLGRWRAAGHDVRVAVNVSARQLETGEFVRQVRNTLLCHHVPPSSLSLEITEHHLMRDVEGSASQLAELRALGVRIALDDFGTGYSSLSYLPRLPVDQEVIFGIPAARSCRSTTRSSTRRSATSSCATSRAPGTRPRATRTPPARSASAWPRAARRDQPRHAARRRVHGLDPDRRHHRPGARRSIGTDAFQEADIRGITMPITKHNFLSPTRRHPARRRRGVPHRHDRPPGPVLVDIPKDALQAETTFVLAGERSTCPATARPKPHPSRSARRPG